MGALHVIGVDLELGLGVDLDVRREQEIVVGLVGVGLLGVGVHENPAVEDAPRSSVEHALVDLVARASALEVIDPGMEVHVLSARRQVEALEVAARLGCGHAHIDVVAHGRRPPSEVR